MRPQKPLQGDLCYGTRLTPLHKDVRSRGRRRRLPQSRAGSRLSTFRLPSTSAADRHRSRTAILCSTHQTVASIALIDYFGYSLSVTFRNLLLRLSILQLHSYTPRGWWYYGKHGQGDILLSGCYGIMVGRSLTSIRLLDFIATGVKAGIQGVFIMKAFKVKK